MNKFFPETVDWMNRFFIKSESNNINRSLINGFDKLHESVTGTLLSVKDTDSYFSFLNNVLSAFKKNSDEEKEYKNKVKETICGFFPIPSKNIYDYCVVLAVIKTILDDPEMNDREQLARLIDKVSEKIAPEIYTIEQHYPDEYSDVKIERKYYPEYFSYDVVMNDMVIKELIDYYSSESNTMKLIELALSEKYGFLLLNDYFKDYCYKNAFDENHFALLPAEIRSDNNYLKILLSKNGNLLSLLTEEQKDDAELVYIAIRNKPESFLFASEKIRNNKIIVNLALEKNGNSLEHTTEEIKKNRDLVLVALKQNYNSLRFAAADLLDDKEFIKTCMIIKGETYKYASVRLRNDVDMIMSLIARDKDAYKFIDPKILDDNPDVCEALLNRNGYTLQIMPSFIKSDKRLVSVAVKTSSAETARFADLSIREDLEFMSTITSINPALYCICGEILKKNEDFAFRNLISNPVIYHFLPVAFKNNEKFKQVYLHSKITEKMWDDYRKSEETTLLKGRGIAGFFGEFDDDLPF